MTRQRQTIEFGYNTKFNLGLLVINLIAVSLLSIVHGRRDF